MEERVLVNVEIKRDGGRVRRRKTRVVTRGQRWH